MIPDIASDNNSRWIYLPTGKLWRRNGATKRWKTRPTEFRVPIKHGLYAYDYMTDANYHEFVLESEYRQWRVQVGKDRGAYKDRYTFPEHNESQAVAWYRGINVGRGYKKRLVNPDGKTIARILT